MVQTIILQMVAPTNRLITHLDGFGMGMSTSVKFKLTWICLDQAPQKSFTSPLWFIQYAGEQSEMISAGFWSVGWSRSWSVDICWSARLAAMIIAGWLRYNETITQPFRLCCDIILGGQDENVHLEEENVHLEEDEEILSIHMSLGAPGPHDWFKRWGHLWGPRH